MNTIARTNTHNFITRHWLGDCTLLRSFWINGALAHVVFAVISLLGAHLLDTTSLQDPEAILGVSYLVAISYVVYGWWFVGAWRSATRRKDFYAITALLMLGFWLLGWIMPILEKLYLLAS